MTFVTIHTRFFNRPALYVLTTPATHVLHHATNPQYLGKNLGALFNVWDRLFGTYAEPDPAVPPELGMRAGHPTHDGVLSQWVLARRLIASARRAPSWAHKWRVVLGRPGWLPNGEKLPAEAAPRGEASIRAGLRWYVAVQFALIGAVGLELLWHRDGYAPSTLLFGSIAVLLGLSSLGGLLDGRRGAVRFEAARVAFTALAGAVSWIR